MLMLYAKCCERNLYLYDGHPLSILLIEGLVMALIEAIFDKEESAREVIHHSLLVIGRKQPVLVLSSCETYLHKHKKVRVMYSSGF